MSTDEPWSDLPTKTTPVLADILAILDSEDSDPDTKNKIITISSLPGLTSGSLNDLTDVTITSQKLGDLLYADSTTSWANLNPGVDGQVLTLAGGVPGWSDNIDITQTPWLQDIDAATFGVFDFGYLIGQNSEVDHTIALPSAFVPIWLGNGEGIAWDTNGGSGAGSDFVILSTDSGDTIEITIENVDEYNFGATEADWNGNNLVNAILQSSVTGNSGITGLGIQLQNLDMGGNTITTTGGNDIFINAPTSQTVSLQINSVLEYDFGGNSADWNGNNIFDVNILSLEPSIDTISAKIYKDGNTDLFFNNAISQNIILGFSETAKYTFSNTQADFGSVNLLNALHDHQDAAGGSVLVATAALTATGTKDSTTFLRGDDTWGIPPGASLPVDDTTAIVQDPADNTKLLRFDVGANTTLITGVIATAFTTAKTITIPDATDTLVGLATTDTLTNKTIDADNNTISNLVIGAEVTGASTALSDTADIAYLNTANTYTAGSRQDFLGLLAGTAGINVGGIAGNPSTQVNGDVWLNTSTNQIFGRINGADVDLGVSGGTSFIGFTADANLDMGSFDVELDATQRLRLNGNGGDSNIYEAEAGVVRFVAGTFNGLTLDGTDPLCGRDTVTASRTTDFLRFAASQGTPTGTPFVTGTSHVPMTFDNQGRKLYVHDASDWREIGATSPWKASTRVASTADIDLAVAADPSPVDGVTLADGDRILLKDQTAGAENGIYDCVTAINPTTWTRSTDADISSELLQMVIAIQEGSVSADLVYMLTTNAPIVIDTTSLVYSEFGGGIDAVVDDSTPELGGQLNAANNNIINLGYLDFNKITIPADPAQEVGRLYVKEVDTNNNSLFIKIEQASSIVEFDILGQSSVIQTVLAADATEESITGTSLTQVKDMSFIKDAISWQLLTIEVDMKTDNVTSPAFLRVRLDGGGSDELVLQTSSLSYVVLSGTIDSSAFSTGRHTLEFYLEDGSGETATLRETWVFGKE